MSKKLFFTAFLICLSTQLEASKRELEYDPAFFDELDRIEAQYTASKQAKLDNKEIVQPIFEFDGDEDVYNPEFFAEIDILTQAHLRNKRTAPSQDEQQVDSPISGLAALNSPPTLVTRKKHKPAKLSKGRKLFGEAGHESQHEDSLSLLIDNPIPSEIASVGLPPEIFSKLIDTGTILKFLTNVYRGNLGENANIFFPRYLLETIAEDGRVTRTQDFFRTPKGQICVFASGGTTNTWEKTVSKVYGIFFNERIKIIRAHWMHKHLRRMGSRAFNMNDYEGEETDLHSELYYDLFFRHFFIEGVVEQNDKIQSLAVEAYSWWEVCDTCEGRFVDQKLLCNKMGIQNFNCAVAAARTYAHEYADTTIQRYLIPADNEKAAWQQIWSHLKRYINLYPHNTVEKRRFWSKTAEGLELSKWIGQAFVENIYLLDGRNADAQDRGDLLKFFNELNEGQGDALEDMEQFTELIHYLSEVNWDLSCWYKGRYVVPTQYNWKKYTHQEVLPHFNYQVLDTYRNEEASSHCQMCGQKNLVEISLVYHPKFKVSSKLLALEDQQSGASTEDQAEEFRGAPIAQRIRSLEVGSECVRFMQTTKEEVDEWRLKNPLEVTEIIAEEKATMLEHYDLLDRISAKSLYEVMCKGCAENDGEVKTRYIYKNSIWENAKDMQPFIDILLKEGYIEKTGRGIYKVLK